MRPCLRGGAIRRPVGTACRGLGTVHYLWWAWGPFVVLNARGGGAVLVRESSVGCGSAVGCGNSPALTKCWLTAASVALVIVSIKSCVWRGEILSLTGLVSRFARGARAGVVRGRESGARRSMRLRAIRGGNGDSVPSSSSGA